MILQLTHYGQDILRKKTRRVREFGEALEPLIEDMFETMYDADGIGLAANQVGVDKAIATIDISQYDESIEPFVIINPEILETEGDEAVEEGCLSIPGVHEEVKRAYRITVCYQTPEGETVEEEAEDIKARVIQHETDHLNGSFFVDRLSPIKRRFLQRKLNTIAREGFPAEEE
ncbi:MAG: peptide deformylase [Candidatus Marinimicrobia bacterium]|nr:peptide deformylase [Candidatus Neomarinimicrobiota bacterium]MCF7829846.1 peptide deformylase [Candidatus Neomarinimicrobiota bacterium]MCF7882474.1 peptide deformylase [Candidatus Neomarinimicrobiota bacterium]